jgi:hypothetical protein
MVSDMPEFGRTGRPKGYLSDNIDCAQVDEKVRKQHAPIAAHRRFWRKNSFLKNGIFKVCIIVVLLKPLPRVRNNGD